MSRLTPEAQAALDSSRCHNTAGPLAEMRAGIPPADEIADLKVRVARLERVINHICKTIEPD